jgi:hypothetical protein
MNGDLDLEQRYRRVLRLLPGYYRAQWEEDMVDAFLEGWVSGDPDDDAWILRFGRPTWPEIASVVGLAARLYLGGASTPRRYFAWGQAVRGTALALLLIHAVAGVDGVVSVFLPGTSYRMVPMPPAVMVATSPGDVWPVTAWYLVGLVWIVVFAALILGYYRTAQVIAALGIVPSLIWLLLGQFSGRLLSPFGSWAFWFLIDLGMVLAMSAFHRDAPPVARRPWLLALPAYILLVSVPVEAANVTSHYAWVPDVPGIWCILVGILCLAHVPRAWSRRAGTGVWSLTLVLLAAVVAVYRLVSLGDYLRDPRLIYYPQGPHLVHVGLVELLIMVVAAALVAPDAARAQTVMPMSPAYPQLG